MVMKLAMRQLQQSDLVLRCAAELPSLLSMSGKVVMLSFRGTRIRVLADESPGGVCLRLGVAEPVTDPSQLELLSGSGEAPDWPRPVLVQAIIEAGSDSTTVVQRASRWASYCARVAVVPRVRLNDRALLEAQLRGVWVLSTGASRHLEVAQVGERTATAGSVRGLAHRLLDELIWEALRESANARTPTARPVATR